MELGGGGGGEDKLSALPDDALIVILLNLNTRDAVRTSILSRRWRRVWTLLPALAFDSHTSPNQIASALQSHEAALECLFVLSRGATGGSMAAWLPIAAPRISGAFLFRNFEQRRITQEGDEEIAQESDEEIPQESDEEEIDQGSDEDEITQESDDDEVASQMGAFDLPCLERATGIALRLGFLGLAMPPTGIFTRLRDLWLFSVWLQGPRLLGDAISWPRCPCLQRLTIINTRGLDNLEIQSNSLQYMCLSSVRGLQKLTIVAPVLEYLKIMLCFYNSLSQPVASIMAPQLETLMWLDLYDPSSVHFAKMEHLRLLQPLGFIAYGDASVTVNPSCLSLLKHFKVIEHLILTLYYQQTLDNNQYMMEDMTMLPDIKILKLNVIAHGHCFGASTFHVLRMCSGISRLMLTLGNTEEQSTCPPGCICIQEQNWKTEQLLLNRLEEVEIDQFSGSEHEFTFVKQLFVWATALEKMMVTFDDSVTESVAKELSQVLRSISRPEICMEVAHVRK